MQVTLAIAGLLPTNTVERVQQLIAAGLELPEGKKQQLLVIVDALAEKLEEAEDAIRTLHERVEELEEFKDKVDDHNEQILCKAYDVVDTCHHSNNTDWISKGMRHILMRDEFLSDEKRNFITECTRSSTPPEMINLSHFGSSHQSQIKGMIDSVNEINYLRDDISLLLVEQILKDLPALIKVNQQVSDGRDATTYISVKLEPKMWNMRADKNFYSPVDYGQKFSYDDHRYDYDFRRSDFD